MDGEGSNKHNDNQLVVYKSARTTVGNLFTKLGDMLSSLPGMESAMKIFQNAKKEFEKGEFAKSSETLKEMIAKAKENPELSEKQKSSISKIMDGITEGLGGLKDLGISAASKSFESMKSAASTIAEKGKNAAHTVTDAASAAYQSVKSTIKNTIKGRDQ